MYVWEGCRESRRCPRDTYPESYITRYTSIRQTHHVDLRVGSQPDWRRARQSRNSCRISLNSLGSTDVIETQTRFTRETKFIQPMTTTKNLLRPERDKDQCSRSYLKWFAQGSKLFIELMTSDRKLNASREGSK